MDLNLVLPWGCLSYRLLLRSVALESPESYSSHFSSGNICWWDEEMYLVLCLYFPLVIYCYTFSWYFYTYSTYKPTISTGFSSLYLFFLGSMIWNLRICVKQVTIQSRGQGGLGNVCSELLLDWFLGQTPVIAISPVCKKYKITAEGSCGWYQKQVEAVTRVISYGCLSTLLSSRGRHSVGNKRYTWHNSRGL